MDRNTFNREIENYIADSKVTNRREFSKMFEDISRELEANRTYFPEKLLNRIEDDLVSDIVKDLNRKLDRNLFGSIYGFTTIKEDYAIKDSLDNFSFVQDKKAAEKLIEETAYELFRNTFSRILKYAEMDRIRIDEDEIRSVINVASRKAGNRIVEDVVNDSFNKLVNKLKDMTKTIAVEKEEVKDDREFYDISDIGSKKTITYNEKAFITDGSSRNEVDELGTTVKPSKPKYDLNHFDKNRVLDGNEVEAKDVPEDVQVINYGDGCFLISPNEMSKIYYYDESLKDKCRLLEDPADIEAAANEIQKSDFYEKYKFSAEYQETLKPFLDEFEATLKQAKYDRGMRDLIGEEGYLRLKEKANVKQEESENAKAFL